MINLDLKAETKEAEEILKHLGNSTKFIQSNILSLVIRKTQSAVKKEYKNYLKKRTGSLYKSISYKVDKKKGTAVLFFPKNKHYIASSLSEGKLIVPKSHKYLCFQINGKWIKTKSIQLKKTPFFAAGVSSYLPQINGDIEKEMEKQIARFNAKRGIS